MPTSAPASASTTSSTSAGGASGCSSAGTSSQFQHFVLSMDVPFSWLRSLQSKGDVLLSVDAVRVTSDAGTEESVLRWTEALPGGKQGPGLSEAWDMCMLHPHARHTFSFDEDFP